MPILKIQPNAIDSTANYVFGGIISNGVDLNAAVAAAYSQANTSAGGDSFARQTANAAFEAANTKLSTSGGTITGNLIVNAFTANTITANGVNLGTAVAEAFVLANNANKSTTSDTAPANPKVGDSWFDTVTGVILRYTYDGVSNNWIDITGPQNAGFIYQSYSITPNTSTINETTGNTVIYTVATTNTADNTVLYWTNSGTTVAADFSDSVSNGSVTITNNSGTITRSLTADATTEGSQTIILSLRTGSNTGPVVAVATTVTVGDTSQSPVPYSLNYLSVAGGGGGGGGTGGTSLPCSGGGAGGYLTGTLMTPVLINSTYTITVGAGGTGGSYNPSIGDTDSANGVNSSIANTSSLVVSVGGGRGVRDQNNGMSGGSGSGGNFNRNGGAGTAGQGNAGGGSTNSNLGGSGGGAGAVGGSNGAAGGIGLQSSITGTPTYYAGGGGGGRNTSTGRIAGGLGGGGAGNYSTTAGTNSGYDNRYGIPGTENLGGGGGATGGYGSPTNVAGSGGSGVVILSYIADSQKGTGGTVTSYTSGSDTYWVHTFTTSGIYTVYA
jgi:hypothetical protein